MRGRRILELGEVVQEANPEVVALLGMKLDTVDIRGAHRTAEFAAVGRGSSDIGAAGALEIVGMQEIEFRSPLEFLEERIPLHCARIVPAHVR